MEKRNSYVLLGQQNWYNVSNDFYAYIFKQLIQIAEIIKVKNYASKYNSYFYYITSSESSAYYITTPFWLPQKGLFCAQERRFGNIIAMEILLYPHGIKRARILFTKDS